MNFARVLSVFTFLAFLFINYGCSDQEQPAMQVKESETTTIEDVKKEAGELVEATKEYTLEQKEAYERQLAGKFEEYEKKLSTLRQQLNMAGGDVKQRMQEKIESLQGKLDDMKSMTEQLKDTSGEAWNDMKVGLDKAEDDLNKAFSDAMQNFK